MHETALMQNMLGLAEDALAGHQVKRVTQIILRVGRLANVIPDALEMAFEMMTQEGLFQGAKLTMEQAPVKARCVDCGREYQTQDLPLTCPDCGAHHVDILDGTEVFLIGIEFDGQDVANHG